MQNVLQAIVNYIDQHKNSKENPHTVTAAQTGAYTKEETNEAINQKIVDIGGGDMQQAVYDPTGKRKDIFAEISITEENLSAKIYANAPMYMAIYKLDSWNEADEESKEKGYNFTQTVEVSAYTQNAPEVTTSSKFRPGIGSPKTGVSETDAILKQALTVIADGVTTTGENSVTTLVKEKPTSDIPVVFTLITEG